MVVINSIEAINEIHGSQGGIEVTRGLIISLLNRIKEFNEWGQITILKLAFKYEPENTEEMFDIMNLLEERFKHANSAIVLGAIKVFLHLTMNDEHIQKQVFDRI